MKKPKKIYEVSSRLYKEPVLTEDAIAKKAVRTIVRLTLTCLARVNHMKLTLTLYISHSFRSVFCCAVGIHEVRCVQV